MNLAQATDVFVTAVASLKSERYGYTASRVDGLWVMQDDPQRKGARTSEVVAVDDDPERVVQAIEKAGVGWHFLSHLLDSNAEQTSVRDAYKNLGYRAQSTEWMFVHDLSAIPSNESLPPVRLIATQHELDQVPQQASQKRKLRPGTSLFGIFDEKRDYGWVRSVPVGSDAWVSGLYVSPDSRGQGLGRALMSALLLSEREHGVQWSVLLASSSGARLYPHLGYRQIGTLRMFCPKDRSRYRK